MERWSPPRIPMRPIRELRHQVPTIPRLHKHQCSSSILLADILLCRTPLLLSVLKNFLDISSNSNNSSSPPNHKLTLSLWLNSNRLSMEYILSGSRSSKEGIPRRPILLILYRSSKRNAMQKAMLYVNIKSFI